MRRRSNPMPITVPNYNRKTDRLQLGTLIDITSESASRRLYQPIGPIELGESVGWSKYNSAQFAFQQRLTHGVTVLANYTISKSVDISSGSSLFHVG